MPINLSILPLSADCTCGACGPIPVGAPHPQDDGNVVQARLSSGTESDFILEAMKPSLRGTLVQYQYLTNPGTHDPKSPDYIRSKSVKPDNDVALFERSVLIGTDRYAKDENGVYHRFDGTNGVFHWNGCTDGRTKSGEPRSIREEDIPKEAKDLLGK